LGASGWELGCGAAGWPGSVAPVRHLPMYDIRVRTERLELRLPTLEELDQLATLAAAGVHPPQLMPFAYPWTDRPSPQLERQMIQWHLLQIANWSPADWSFNPVVLRDGQVIGTQGISAKQFSVTRSFVTGSWLGRLHQGRGLGREMRAAVLHLGFAGLGAQSALSAAFADNPASLGVSRSLGYRTNGELTVERRGLPARQIHLRISREGWEQSDRPRVELEGVESGAECFGA